MSSNPTIDCQDCGTILRRLTPTEVRAVAREPFNFIWYCAACNRDRAAALDGETT